MTVSLLGSRFPSSRWLRQIPYLGKDDGAPVLAALVRRLWRSAKDKVPLQDAEEGGGAEPGQGSGKGGYSFCERTHLASFGLAQTNAGGSAWCALYSFCSRLIAILEADMMEQWCP